MENFKLTAQLSTYLYSVCRFIWSDELKKRNKWQPAQHGDLLLEKEQDAYEREEKHNMAEKAIAKLSQKCQEK